MISKRGSVAGNTWSKHYNCFRQCPMPFLLSRWCPRWRNLGGSTTLSTPLKWRRYCSNERDFLMTAAILLDELRTKGVHLTVEGEHLAVDAPKNVLNDDVRQAIRQHKQELLALLAYPAPLTPHYPCVVCGNTDRWEDRGIWRCRRCWPPLAV